MNTFFSHIHEGNIYHYLSGGVWQVSGPGKLLDVISPIDQSVVGRVQAMSKEEIDRVISNSSVSQKEWKEMEISDRAAILKKAAQLLRDHCEEVALMQVLEVGKLVSGSRKEIMRTADIIDYTAGLIDTANEQTVLEGSEFSQDAAHKTAHVLREPHGVVLAIGPFNYPVNLLATKIAPALMMGNSVVVKASLQGTLSALMLVEIFNQAGVPAGVISAVTGDSHEIGDYLVSHPDIAMVSFTGSTTTGKRIAQLAGNKPLQLEMGGKDAALVLSDADLDRAAEEIVAGAFSYAGQRCTAIKRVLAHVDIVEELTHKIATITREKYHLVGDPRDEKSQMGPLISIKQAEYASELLEDATASGAKILVGGEVKLNYMDVFVLSQVTGDMRIAWEEQFAPILPIITCESEEQMIILHNQSQYGLGVSIFTQNIEQAREIAGKLQAGVIQINAKSERYPDHFPFLGVKDSGLGVQGIAWSMQAVSRVKSVVYNK
ncbi:MAG: aldehyde dehydrogenase family protein [Patescibacteria group bacterium]